MREDIPHQVRDDKKISEIFLSVIHSFVRHILYSLSVIAIIKWVERISHCQLIGEKKKGCAILSIPVARILFFTKQWQRRNAAKRQRSARARSDAGSNAARFRKSPISGDFLLFCYSVIIHSMLVLLHVWRIKET